MRTLLNSPELERRKWRLKQPHHWRTRIHYRKSPIGVTRPYGVYYCSAPLGHAGIDRESLGQRPVELPYERLCSYLWHCTLHHNHHGDFSPDQCRRNAAKQVSRNLCTAISNQHYQAEATA